MADGSQALAMALPGEVDEANRESMDKRRQTAAAGVFFLGGRPAGAS
jgi:hypothetical protein